MREHGLGDLGARWLVPAVTNATASYGALLRLDMPGAESMAAPGAVPLACPQAPPRGSPRPVHDRLGSLVRGEPIGDIARLWAWAAAICLDDREVEGLQYLAELVVLYRRETGQSSR